jgi:tetratricopeptide (TPR) repeat protein
MKNVIARFWALVVLVFLLIPGVKASGQTQNAQSPPDEISVRQARRAIVSAGKYAGAFHPANFAFHYFSVNPSSLVLTLDSLDFDATNKKKETKHFRINLKSIEKLSAICNGGFCSLDTASGNYYTIQDKEAVEYRLYFGWDPYGPGIPLCSIAGNAADCPQSAAWFAAALNSLHAYAISHPNDSGDFHQQAAEWRALTAKPPQPEEVRVQRLLAEDAVKNNKPVEAMNDYEIGLQSSPTWPEGHFNAALIAAELNDFADAVDHMQSYLELVPNAPDAQAARDQLTIWQHKAGQQMPAGAK